MTRVSSRAIGAACVLLVLAVPATAQQSLTEVQSLYANAQYEEALAALNQMRSAGLAIRDVPPVEQYRALCLLALGRPSEAEEAITAVITAMPSYAPPDRDVSPRVRSAFQDVRRRVIPVVVQQKYGSAKAAFEQQDYATARDAFAQVTALLGDPGLADLVGQPPLADLALLAKGFHDLSITSIVPVAATPTSASPSGSGLAPSASASTTGAAGIAPNRRGTPNAAATPASTTASANRTVARAPVYGAADTQVVPPVVLRQTLPPYPRKPLMPHQGIVEVVVDERGAVESAIMRQSVDNVYDTLALAAARTWQYRPAMKDGVAVKYRKGIQIRIQP